MRLTSTLTSALTPLTSPGRQLFAAIKNTTRAGGPHLVLPVGQPLRAVLRPVATVAGALDREDVRLITEWRNRHVKSFLTEFVATEERTSNWLAGHVHENEGKMLFMVDLPNGERVGHVGLGFIDWNRAYGEADAIVSGGASPPGLMKAALLELMRWAKEVLGLKTLAVRVRSDNSALEFYRKTGFRETARVAIVAQTVADGIDWAENPEAHDASASLVHMLLEFAGQADCSPEK